LFLFFVVKSPDLQPIMGVRARHEHMSDLTTLTLTLYLTLTTALAIKKAVRQWPRVPSEPG
jgi:hypothetical protein